MYSYVFRRVFSALPTLFVVITISFFLMRVAPGGPFNLERPLEAKVMENLMRIYNLDKPLWEQYAIYLYNLFQGDLGPSYFFRDFSVAELIAQGLPISVQLGGLALLLALTIGCGLGVIGAIKQNQPADFGVIALATIGITIPNFVVAPVLTLFLAVHFDILPAGGWGDGALANKVLPVLTLALPQVAVIARLTRGSMIEALHSHHIRTARAYGLPGRVVVVRI